MPSQPNARQLFRVLPLYLHVTKLCPQKPCAYHSPPPHISQRAHPTKAITKKLCLVHHTEIAFSFTSPGYHGPLFGLRQRKPCWEACLAEALFVFTVSFCCVKAPHWLTWASSKSDSVLVNSRVFLRQGVFPTPLLWLRVGPRSMAPGWEQMSSWHNACAQQPGPQTIALQASRSPSEEGKVVKRWHRRDMTSIGIQTEVVFHSTLTSDSLCDIVTCPLLSKT
jgi:hypothetical protein